MPPPPSPPLAGIRRPPYNMRVLKRGTAVSMPQIVLPPSMAVFIAKPPEFVVSAPQCARKFMT